MAPKLRKVIRLDSLPLGQTYFTPEGYLMDRPILTRTGIFEYCDADGSVRRELRLPEEVFAEESLASYQGKPIIITHDAGLVTKDNVQQEQIGTILTEGYRNGDDVRAEIVIHNTDAMKNSGLKELSLGYNLDLDETPGEWNGEHYDAIQRNIRINHLALVREARAGETARLNIDSRDKISTLKGGKAMSKKIKKNARRADGVLSAEELEKAIEEYKARRAESSAAKADEEIAEEDLVVSTEPATEPAETANADSEGEAGEGATVEEKVDKVKQDRKDRRGDQKTECDGDDTATATIAKQDEDIDMLLDIIDTLLAEREFNQTATDGDDVVEEPAKDEATEEEGATEEEATDGEEAEEAPAETKEASATVNADSVDSIVRQRVKIGMIGRTLNIDGLEDMNIREAKKTIITAVRPGIRLDGKSEAYLNAMFDCAVDEVKKSTKKDVSYQKKQMFNKDGKTEVSGDSSASAREKMIARQKNKKED